MQDNNKSKCGIRVSSFDLTVAACHKLIYLLILLLATFQVQAQNTADYNLESNINQCVALRQGQSCYKKIKINWQTNNADDYCVVELGSNKIIQCWQQQNQGSVNVEFESDKDTRYALRKQAQTENLATVEIKISWVYEPKPSKSTGWRLF